MARHGFGSGEYKYFDYPLPPLIDELRTKYYPSLAKVANAWERRLGGQPCFPDDLSVFLQRCHEAGQSRPTPLMLRYGSGDYNSLHQDVYGDLCFPLRIAVFLSDPGVEFTGGEFVLTEHRPRMQSRAEVVPLRRGDGVMFPVRERPITGIRSIYKARMRHGVSRVRSGLRYTLGVIFHDSR